MGKHFPGASGPEHVEDAIDDFAHVYSTMSATRLLRRNQGFKQLPLLVCDW